MTLKDVIKQSYIVESLDFEKHKDITNRIINCANISLQLLQFTDLTEIKNRELQFWEDRSSKCIKDKNDFEEIFRKEIISISNQTLGVSVDLRFLNLDTNFISMQKVKFPIIAGLARRLGDRLGTKLQFMVKYLLPKMTSIIDQDGKSGNGGKPDQLSPSFSSATINKSGFPLSSR